MNFSYGVFFVPIFPARFVKMCFFFSLQLLRDSVLGCEHGSAGHRRSDSTHGRSVGFVDLHIR